MRKKDINFRMKENRGSWREERDGRSDIIMVLIKMTQTNVWKIGIIWPFVFWFSSLIFLSLVFILYLRLQRLYWIRVETMYLSCCRFLELSSPLPFSISWLTVCHTELHSFCQHVILFILRFFKALIMTGC